MLPRIYYQNETKGKTKLSASTLIFKFYSLMGDSRLVVWPGVTSLAPTLEKALSITYKAIGNQYKNLVRTN